MELTLVQKIAVYALPVIFAITVHEAAHGYAALGCVLHGPLLFCLRPKAAGRGYIFLS